MLTPNECGDFAEKMIVYYAKECGVETSDDVRKVGEMLISKMAICIVEYAGNSQAKGVIERTMKNIERFEGGAA